MKKLVAVVLILVAVFALCACGETQVIEKEVEKTVEVPVVPEAWQKYQSIFDALEAEDFDSAQALIEDMKPVPETPPIVEVQITKENFFDYFEYVCEPQYEYAERDSKGNYTNVGFDVKYVLKDEFSIAKEKIDECSVDSGVTFKFVWYSDSVKKTINFDTFEYTVKGGNPFISKEDAMFRGKCVEKDDKTSYEIPFYSGSIGSYCIGYTGIQVYEDIKLVSASGTLYLYE